MHTKYITYKQQQSPTLLLSFPITLLNSIKATAAALLISSLASESPIDPHGDALRPRSLALFMNQGALIETILLTGFKSDGKNLQNKIKQNSFVEEERKEE
jgi:hypothetical protein